MTQKTIVFVSVLILAAACQFKPAKQSLRLAWAGPNFPSGFNCVGVVVTGEGIPSANSAQPANWQSLYEGGMCPYPGISSSLQAVKAGTTVEFELQVPSGNKRTVQVLGLTTSDGTCPKSTVSDLLVAQQKGQLDKNLTALYELGRANTATQKPTTLPVANSYDAKTSKNLLDCVATGGGGGGGKLALPYATLTLFKKDTVILSARGGTPPYSFTVNIGSIVGANYTAPLIPATGQVTVTDQDGNGATANLSIVDPAGFATLKHWFSARSFGTALNDGDTIPNGAPWQNDGSATGDTPLHSQGVNGKTLFYKGVGPLGLPVVQVDATSLFVSPTGTVNAPFAIFVSARRLAQATSGIFCLASTNNCAADNNSAFISFSSAITPTITMTTRQFSESHGPTTGDANASPTDWALLRGVTTIFPRVVEAGYNLSTPAANSHSMVSFAPGGHIYLAADDASAGAGVKMQIAEILVFENVIDITALSNAVNAKYGF